MQHRATNAAFCCIHWLFVSRQRVVALPPDMRTSIPAFDVNRCTLHAYDGPAAVVTTAWHVMKVLAECLQLNNVKAAFREGLGTNSQQLKVSIID